MGLWKKVVRGNLNEGTLRKLRPGYVAARRGGRLDYFRDTADVLGTMGKSSYRQGRAIRETGKILAHQSQSTREAFLGSFMLSLSHRDLKHLKREYNLRSELTDARGKIDPAGVAAAKQEFSRLVARQGQDYLEKVLTHDAVVEKVDVAGRRFFGKNVAAVYMKGAKGRKGFGLGTLFEKSTARDEIASGILAAIEDIGLKKKSSRPDPVPVDVSEGETAPHSGDIPDVSEPGSHTGAAHVDVSEPDGTGAAATMTVSGEDTPSEATSGTEMLETALGEVFAPRDLHLHSLMMRGLTHHKSSASFFSGKNTAVHEAKLNELLGHANEFSAHVVTNGFGSDMTAGHAQLLAKAALETNSVRNFQIRLKAIIKAQGGDAKAAGELIPKGHTFFVGPRKATPSIVNLLSDELRVGTSAEDAVKLTPLQKQAIAFHMSAKIAKIGASTAGDPAVKPKEHLAAFVYHSPGLRNAGQRDFRNVQLAPMELNANERGKLLLAFMGSSHSASLTPEQRAAILSHIVGK